MKIPAQLHQFRKETALVIVSGAYEARVFLAKDGEFSQKKFEEVSTREDYSDREGFWRTGRVKTKRDAGNVGTWGSTEHHKEYLHDKFLHALRDDTFDLFLKEHVTGVYLFAPHYISLAITERGLHPFLKQRIKMNIEGDYQYHHPVEILKMITKERRKGIQHKDRASERLRVIENEENLP